MDDSDRRLESKDYTHVYMSQEVFDRNPFQNCGAAQGIASIGRQVEENMLYFIKT